MPRSLPLGILLSVPVLLIVSIVVVSLIGFASERFRAALVLDPARIRARFEVHRLLTAGWLHADVSHLFFNLLTLYFFAGDAHKVFGDVRFVVLYVTAVVMSFVPSTLRHMRNPKYRSLGASGAVAAVLVSAVLLHPGLKLQLLFLPIPIPGLLYAALYLAYSAWHSYASDDRVNHDAHFFGAIYGAIFTYAFEPARVERTLRALF